MQPSDSAARMYQASFLTRTLPPSRAAIAASGCTCTLRSADRVEVLEQQRKSSLERLRRSQQPRTPGVHQRPQGLPLGRSAGDDRLAVFEDRRVPTIRQWSLHPGVACRAVRPSADRPRYAADRSVQKQAGKVSSVRAFKCDHRISIVGPERDYTPAPRRASQPHGPQAVRDRPCPAHAQRARLARDVTGNQDQPQCWRTLHVRNERHDHDR
jgi:hypothetical protein